MKSEQTKVMEVLQLAIQMEADGKKFYQKASRKSSNKLAKELFQQLAKEEDVHRKKFEEIYKAFKRGQNWPDVEPPSEKGRKIKSLFGEASSSIRLWREKKGGTILPFSIPTSISVTLWGGLLKKNIGRWMELK